MPKGKHLRGVGKKEQREYEHMKEERGEVRLLRKARQGSRGSEGDEAAQKEAPQKGKINKGAAGKGRTAVIAC